MSKKRFRNSRNYFLVGLILIIAGYFIIKYFENQREQEHIDTLSEYLIENKLVDSTRLKEPFGVLVSANANDTIIKDLMIMFHCLWLFYKASNTVLLFFLKSLAFYTKAQSMRFSIFWMSI